MRSVVVVLPASTCAMTPMFLSFLVFMQNFLTAGVHILTHAARVALGGTATPKANPREGSAADGRGRRVHRDQRRARSHAAAETRAHWARASASGNRGNQLVVGAHGGWQKKQNPGAQAVRG